MDVIRGHAILTSGILTPSLNLMTHGHAPRHIDAPHGNTALDQVLLLSELIRVDTLQDKSVGPNGPCPVPCARELQAAGYAGALPPGRCAFTASVAFSSPCSSCVLSSYGHVTMTPCQRVRVCQNSRPVLFSTVGEWCEKVQVDE